MNYREVLNKFKFKEYVQFVEMNNEQTHTGTLKGNNTYQGCYIASVDGQDCSEIIPIINDRDISIDLGMPKTGILIYG